MIVSLALLSALCIAITAATAITLHPDLADLIRHDNVTSDSKGGRLLCKSIRTRYMVHGNTSQCCVVHGLPGVRCLPSFLIAGVQKAGTTALAAFLAHQAQILSLAPKKEVHFFDKSRAYTKGVPHYLSAFHPWDYAGVGGFFPPLYGESSPFYVASPLACRRIANTLPGARLVVLLREPVARAYSEWQMKKRRVEQQETFLALAVRHQQLLRSCLLRCSSTAGVDWRAMRQCVPSELAAHTHFEKFVYGVNTLTSAGDDAAESCFLLAPSGASASLNSSSPQPAAFLPQACMGKYARERLPSLQAAFPDDIEHFRTCAGRLLDAGNSSHPGRDLARAVRKCLKVTLGISRHYVYRSLYAAQLFSCYQSVPRDSMLVLPSERLLARPLETLAAVMAFIGVPAEHIQRALRRDNSSSAEDVMGDGVTGELVRKYFPHFERNTGWRLRSEYPPPPAELRESLRTFFAPYNEQLFQLLGAEPYPEWE